MIDDIEYQIAGYLIKHPEESQNIEMLMEQIQEDREQILDRSNMRGHITASILVLSHDKQNVLLIHHNQLQLWLQPGGHVDPTDTSLYVAALRELMEETGLKHADLIDYRPFDIDTHLIPARPSKNEGEHYHHDFIYLAIATKITVLSHQAEEVSEARWVPISGLLESHSRMQRLARKMMIYASQHP